MKTINVGRRLRKVSLGLDEARLEVDDVITELIILSLNGFVILIQQSIIADLLLKLLDVTFFALPESSLYTEKSISSVYQR